MKKKIYTIKLKSYNFQELDKFAILIQYLAAQNQIILKGPVFLPSKKSDIILLTSPHVHKKAREHFCFVIHKRLFILYNIKETLNIKNFIKKITNSTPGAISMKIIKNNRPKE